MHANDTGNTTEASGKHTTAAEHEPCKEKNIAQAIHAFHEANIAEAEAKHALDEAKKNEIPVLVQSDANQNMTISQWILDKISYIIPAKEGEWGRLAFLSTIGFFLVFAYSLLRAPKDLLIISVGGAELIPFLKILVLGVTFLATAGWDSLKKWCQPDSNNADTENRAFYIGIAIFTTFFVGFIAIFPQLGLLQGFSISFLPAGLSKMVSFWAFSLFYIFTEMWAVITVEGIFKSLQNTVFPQKERVRALAASFGIWQNCGLIAASFALSSFFSAASGLSLYTQLLYTVGMFAASSILVMAVHLAAIKLGIFKFGQNAEEIQNKIRSNDIVKATNQIEENKSALKAAEEASSKALDHIKTLATEYIDDGIFTSKENGITKKDLESILIDDQFNELTEVEKNYVRKAFYAAGTFRTKLSSIASQWDLRDLAVVALAYNMCMVIFEVVWKNQVKIFTSSGASSLSYVEFMSNFNFWTGTISIALALANPIINMLPPEVQGLLTPVLLLFLSAVFFGLLLAPTFMATICPTLFSSSVSNLYWQIALIGTIQNVAVKACKYSVFDPLNSASWAAKPKAVKQAYQDSVNQITGKMGKALGSVILLALLAYGGTLTNVVHLIPIVLATILTMWGFSAYNVATTVSGTSLIKVDPVASKVIGTDQGNFMPGLQNDEAGNTGSGNLWGINPVK